MYRALLRIYRALLRIYRALFQMYRARLRMYRALLRMYRALLRTYRAILRIYSALLRIYRAILRKYKTLWQTMGLFCGHSGLFCTPSRCTQTIYTTYINFGRAAVKRDCNFPKRVHPLYGFWTLPSQHRLSVTKFCHGSNAWDAWMLEIKKTVECIESEMTSARFQNNQLQIKFQVSLLRGL